MSNASEERAREILLEAFTAGWQAAQAVTITNPRVLRVIENCFDLWLLEAVDEVEVLGLPFRGRADMPGPRLDEDWPFGRAEELAGLTDGAAEPENGDHRRPGAARTLWFLPRPRRSTEEA